MKFGRSAYVSAFVSLLACIGLWACATQVAPSGGPADKLPPRVAAVYPALNTTNHPEELYVKLEFDEEKQAYTILDESQFNNGFLPAYLNSGSEAFAWWAGGADWLMGSIYWNLIRITDPTLVGIQDTQADTQGNMPEGLYTLDGRKIGTGNVRPGIYIKANGSSVKKVLIK